MTTETELPIQEINPGSLIEFSANIDADPREPETVTKYTAELIGYWAICRGRDTDDQNRIKVKPHVR